MGEADDITVMVAALRGKFGAASVLTGEDAQAQAHGWSDFGTPLAVVRPRSTAETAEMLLAFTEKGVPIVPWGGKTGLVGGGSATGAVAISFDRMAVVEMIDSVDRIMLVEAGCTVQAASEAAEAKGMFFPLDLGSGGSATIGGVVSTNAGGLRVLRFGMMREQVLGLEVVLADGSIVSALHPLMKNNTGYDIKQLFIGAEGTLGVVTRAMLRLRPALPSRSTALLGLNSFAHVATLLVELERRLGGMLSTYELMWAETYRMATSPPSRPRPILPNGYGYYVLVEAMGGDQDADRERFEAALAEIMESGIIADAVVAQSEREADDMWSVRHDGELTELAPFVAVDVSLRVSVIAEYVDTLRAEIEALWPGSRTALVGHIGDGNIHVVVSLEKDDTADRRKAISEAVMNCTARFQGSISAEHGIGLDKRNYLSMSRSAAEIEVMRAIKRALDPRNLMNPGKVLPPVPGKVCA
jgi:FAD/FMN-containing dehydrogenase